MACEWQLHVLGAFICEISSFLSPGQQRELSHIHRSIDPLQQSTSVRNNLLLQCQQDLPILAYSLMQTLVPSAWQKSRQRRKRTSVLNASQARTIAHDLVLVALGVRPSCLVDCAVLDLATVQLLLDSATRDPAWNSFSIARVYAVLLNDNVFFVNASIWLREKRIELASRLRDVAIINVSPHLSEAQWINPRTPNEDIGAIHSDLEQLCNQLQLLKRKRSQSPSRIVVLNKLQSEPIAVAGLLLCYPVVYAVFDPSKLNAPEGWTTQENCLAMTPLHVLSSSFAMYVIYRSPHSFHLLIRVSFLCLVLSVSASPSAFCGSFSPILSEFSVPQHVLVRTQSLSLRLIHARCRLKLTRVLGPASASGISGHVQISPRTLAQVAL